MEYKEKISNYYTSEHQKNQQKIKYGILCVIGIPLIFLILMFTMKSSKLVYLVLWIAALFLISAYLISVEYKDYLLQKQFNALIGEDATQPLIELPNIMELVGLEDIEKPEQEIEIAEQEIKTAKQNIKKSMQEIEKLNQDIEIPRQDIEMPRQDIETTNSDIEKSKQDSRTADLEKEIQMLQEIARLRTQLGMGDYSNLYKDHSK